MKAAAIDDLTKILIMIDGDRFKAVNDNYGHSLDDEALYKAKETLNGGFSSTPV